MAVLTDRDARRLPRRIVASINHPPGQDLTVSAADASNCRFSSLAVPWPVLLVAGLMFAGLVAVSGAYGFHGDEMYYCLLYTSPSPRD